MKKFEAIHFDPEQCLQEAQEFRALLAGKPSLKERKEILPFFRKRKHLSAYLGSYHPHITRFDLVAHEFSLFGGFGCDLVVGDSKNHAFAFIEFEDADPAGAFVQKRNKATPEWSRRFEHGFSQLLDWFFLLQDEGITTEFEERFGSRTISHLGLLVIGRSGEMLGPRERRRLRWRQEFVLVNSKQIHCKTFDQLCDDLLDRLDKYPLAAKAEAAPPRQPGAPDSQSSAL